jgi:small subunit ribosomal protein S2
VDYPIPGNDDALRAVGLLTHVIADAIADGLMARAGGAVAGAPADADVEPLADWEKELLTGTADAAPAEAPAAEANTAEAPAAE